MAGAVVLLTAISAGAVRWRRQKPYLLVGWLWYLVTLLPVLTGYLAYNHLLLPYTLMLALHLLSVELLMVVAPFTKLTHMFSFATARWYQGYQAGRRGVES